MNQLVRERARRLGGVGDAVAEEVDFPLVGEPGRYPVIRGSAPEINFAFGLSNQNGGLVAKLGQALFNFLRKRAD